MAGALLTTATLDDAAVIAALDGLAARSSDLSTPMAEIAEILGSTTRERFETGRDPAGNPWTPLSPRTIESKTRRKRPLAILVDGGQLMMIAQRSTATEAIVGTNRVYGGAHQFGAEIRHYARSRVQKVTASGRFARSGSRAKGRRRITIGEHVVKIPARPYLGISSEDRVRCLEALIDHLEPA